MKTILFLLLFSFSSVFGASVFLYNDSPYSLIAEIHSANGKVIGQQTMLPGDQGNWSTDMVSTNLDVSFDNTSSDTPFSVIWKCSYEGIYSTCVDVATGANVTANTCNGPKYCKPKPKQQDQDADGQPQAPQQDTTPSQNQQSSTQSQPSTNTNQMQKNTSSCKPCRMNQEFIF